MWLGILQLLFNKEKLLYNMYKCPKCDMKFTDEIRLERHMNTHKKRAEKGTKQKQNSMPDFDKPDFSQVM